jgi:predicted nucleotidyltransferase
MSLSPAIDRRVAAILEAGRKLFRDSPRSIRAAILYGSVLGPGFRADSDIDIAILDNADDRLSWHEQAKLMDRLEMTLKRGVDLRMLRDGSLSYQMHVLKHGRLVWEREAGESARYARKVLPSLQAAHERSAQE